MDHTQSGGKQRWEDPESNQGKIYRTHMWQHGGKLFWVLFRNYGGWKTADQISLKCYHRQNNDSPKHAQVLIHRPSDYVKLSGKRLLRVQTEARVRIISWPWDGRLPGLSSQLAPILSSQGPLQSREGRKGRARERTTTKTWPDIAGFDDRAMGQGKQAASRSWRSEEADFLLEPLEGT